MNRYRGTERAKRFLLALALIALGDPAAIAWGAPATEGGAPPDPAELLARVNATMGALLSAQGRSEVVIHEDGPAGVAVFRRSFEWTRERSGNESTRGHVALETPEGRAGFDMETRAVDGVNYIKTSNTGAWELSAEGLEETPLERFTDELLNGRLDLRGVESGSDGDEGLTYLAGIVPGGSIRVRLTLDPVQLLVHAMTAEGELGEANGDRPAPRMQAEARIIAFDVPAEVQAPVVFVETPHGPMRRVVAGVNRLSYLLPAGWAPQPPPAGVRAAYQSPEGGALLVAVDDLILGGVGEATLDGYTATVLESLEEVPGFELASQREFAIEGGLTANLLSFTIHGGQARGYRLLYLRDGRMGMNLTFVAQPQRFDALEPTILYILRELRFEPGE